MWEPFLGGEMEARDLTAHLLECGKPNGGELTLMVTGSKEEMYRLLELVRVDRRLEGLVGAITRAMDRSSDTAMHLREAERKANS